MGLAMRHVSLQVTYWTVNMLESHVMMNQSATHADGPGRIGPDQVLGERACRAEKKASDYY